ncbi:MAG TPA: ATP-binding protein [Dongiaceae bacterium]|nr:ATP-binding protein [Dongiaceae bacterium]
MALFLLSSIYVTIYILRTTAALEVPNSLEVGLIPAIGAGLVFTGSVTLFFLTKKVTSFIPSFIVYLLFAASTAYVTWQTGGASSFFLPVWTLVLFFAALFGAYGWLPLLVLTGSYTAGTYLSGELTIQTTVIILLSSIVPLAAGIIIWRDPPAADEMAAKSVKNLANQLSEVATKSEIVINAIGDGVIAVDGKGVIQLINPAAQEILGWGKQDALSLNYKSILKLADENSKDLDPAKDPLQQVLNTNQQTRGNKLIAITQSGKKINISLVVSPIGETGSGAIAVFRDVTNERAEEREQAEFISTASHEMRTPVASIEGYLGLALNPNTATVDQKARDFIMKAHEAAQHLGRLFQDLLDVSKSEDGRMTNVPKVVDMVPFTETIVQGLIQKAADKGLTLSFLPTAGNHTERGIRTLTPVYFVNQDNDHIREILDNLIENAIKYTRQGSVTVDVTGTDDRVVISIKDSGLGIPPEDAPHLFQKFYRVNNMDRQDIGGTGLGLYLSRRLAEAMQGRLWVESVFGQGSTFFLELPRISSQEAERQKAIQSQQMVAAPALAAPLTPAAPVVPAPTATPSVSIPVQVIEAPAPAAPTPTQPPAQVPDMVVIPPTEATPAPSSAGARPATTVPRGETLTREQINARVQQLEALAQQQRAAASASQGRQ